MTKKNAAGNVGLDVNKRITNELDKAGILTPENVAAIACPYDVCSVLPMLNGAEFLTQENFTAIVSHAVPRDVCKALCALNDAKILTQENFTAIVVHASPYSVGSVLCLLNGAEILTQENRVVIDAHAILNTYIIVIGILNEAGILTQENFNQLFAANHAGLVSRAIVYSFWNLVPSRLLSQAVFDHVITLAQDAGYGDRIAAYTEELLRDADRNAVEPNNQPPINYGQSIHNSAVEKSVSISVIKLRDRYGRLEGAKLENKLEEIKKYIEELPEDSARCSAAKRCWTRATDPNGFTEFIHRDSGISTKTLLGLIWVAIHDNENRKGTLDDALGQFVEALYEMQRGYNIGDEGVDLGGVDSPICSTGSFNKLIEKLKGIHPDVEIRFITSATASEKLQIVVLEEAIQYLKEKANVITAKDAAAFVGLIEQIKNDGVDVIFGKIKDSIAVRIYDEFSVLYESKDDSNFTSLVNGGEYLQLADANLRELQEQFTSARGYREYCSNMMLRSAGFFSRNSSGEKPIEPQTTAGKCPAIFYRGYCSPKFGLQQPHLVPR